MSHKQGHERDAFAEAVENDNRDALHTASGRLWNCTDVMPSTLCDDLEMPLGSSYAQGARRVRAREDKLPTWERIAGDLDRRESYLLTRCLAAEGKDPRDSGAMIALLDEMDEQVPYTRA